MRASVRGCRGDDGHLDRSKVPARTAAVWTTNALSAMMAVSDRALESPLITSARRAGPTRLTLVYTHLVVIALVVAGCGLPSPVTTPDATTTGSPTASTAAPTALPKPAPSLAPSFGPPPSVTVAGFAFAADDIATYYETQGYVCVAPKPSATAAGYAFRSCERRDGNGRTLQVGLVTDPAGELANAFGSVQGREGETVLAPIDALEPLAGVLGALLGEDRSTTLLTWLGRHLGDAYAETSVADLKIATYTESDLDRSTLYVEVANQAYLEAAPPLEP